MIKIEKLLQELCPNGVDFLRIEVGSKITADGD